MSKGRIAALALAAVLLGAGALAVAGIPAGFLVEAFKGRIESETGYRLRVSGAARIGLWPNPALSLSDIGVLDPRSGSREELFAAQSVEAGMALAPLLRGRVEIAGIAINKPIVRIAMARERAPAPASPSPAAAGGSGGAAIDIGRVTVKDGMVILSDPRRGTESRVEDIQLDARWPGAGRLLDVKGEGRIGTQPLRLQVRSTAPSRAGIAVHPIDLQFEAPGVLEGPLTATTNVTLADKVLKAENLSGRIGTHGFAGTLAADFSAARPSIEAAFGFQRLELFPPVPGEARRSEPAAGGEAQPASPGPWSDKAFDLDDLNFFDAVIRLTATDLSIGKLRLAPVSIQANIASGVLDIALNRSGLYEGEVQGRVIVDASGPTLTQAMRFDIDGVRAFPLLSDAAGFTAIDGRMRAKLDLSARGNSPKDMVSTLGGNADVLFQDGELRGINIARMVRTLMAQILSGWQENGTQKTDFSQLSATFRLADGQATTTDLTLTGPLVRVRGAGTADLLTRELSFRIDPRVVASLEGQGAQQTDPLGLGVPVIVQGSWDAPQIYPDIADIQNNPQAAFEKLRQLGAGLFSLFGSGDSRKGSGQSGGTDIGKSISDLFGSKDTGNSGQSRGSAEQPPADGKNNDLPGAALDLLRGLLGK
ncbi:MAG: AsmA family protein [Pseudorhodoplanes sp.]|nr:AsmA family protein [Pseudorhodoplanes sp.]